MTGAEHFREAERLLKVVDSESASIEWTVTSLAAAQVHATLSLAAAVAEGFVRYERSDAPSVARDWRAAIS